MHKQFNPHIQCLRTTQRIGPQMPQFQKQADNRVWKHSAEAFEALEDDDEKRAYTCTICLEPKLIKEDLWILPCGHFFHKNCILNWGRTKNTCPECRESFADADDRTLLLREENKRRREGGGGAAPRDAPRDAPLWDSELDSDEEDSDDMEEEEEEEEDEEEEVPRINLVEFIDRFHIRGLDPAPVLRRFGVGSGVLVTRSRSSKTTVIAFVFDYYVGQTVYLLLWDEWGTYSVHADNFQLAPDPDAPQNIPQNSAEVAPFVRPSAYFNDGDTVNTRIKYVGEYIGTIEDSYFEGGEGKNYWVYTVYFHELAERIVMPEFFLRPTTPIHRDDRVQIVRGPDTGQHGKVIGPVIGPVSQIVDLKMVRLDSGSTKLYVFNEVKKLG